MTLFVLHLGYLLTLFRDFRLLKYPAVNPRIGVKYKICLEIIYKSKINYLLRLKIKN